MKGIAIIKTPLKYIIEIMQSQDNANCFLFHAENPPQIIAHFMGSIIIIPKYVCDIPTIQLPKALRQLMQRYAIIPFSRLLMG